MAHGELKLCFVPYTTWGIAAAAAGAQPGLAPVLSPFPAVLWCGTAGVVI